MVKILAIETSCDETAAAVVADGRQVLSNVIYSQADLHAKFGGVVPEIASRKHIEAIDKVVDEALRRAGEDFSTIDAVAVTSCPGLVGALLTGVSYAKALSYARKLPLISVHHIKGHIAANYIEDPALKPPFCCLVVSGGHTQIVYVKDYLTFEILAKTRDDAIGETFDKVARVLGLPYPGGVGVDKMAQRGNPEKITFTKPKLGDTDDFSFSGIKTAVNSYLKKVLQKPVLEYADDEVLTQEGFVGLGLKVKEGGITKNDVAASFSKTVVDLLLEPFFRLSKSKGVRTVCLAGGVSANHFLRQEFFVRGKKLGMKTVCPHISLCGDNAAMIGSFSYFKYEKQLFSDTSLNAIPYISIEEEYR